MAKVGNEELEYDSDPEEGKSLLGLRRRDAASDDEEEDRGCSESELKHRVPRRVAILSDEDSDGQGAAADYDDELDDELPYEEDDEVYEEAYEQVADDFADEGVDRSKVITEIVGDDARNKRDDAVKAQNYEEFDEEDEGETGEEEKKTNEPFAVPTAGAFYMHDDRFRDNAVGRNRRTYGGRKLWESMDEQRWGHDKFEEMSVHDRQYGQGRRSGRGGYRGRGGRNRATDRGYNRRIGISRSSNNGESQDEAGKGVKGRGPRRYEYMMRNIHGTPPISNRYPPKAPEKQSNVSSSKVYQQISNAEMGDAPPAKKYSSLSSSSPPFYPSGSSSKEVVATQKREVRATNKNLSNHTTIESDTVEPSNDRGKNSADSIAVDKLYINEPNAKYQNTSQYSTSGSSMVNATQSVKGQGRGNGVSGQMMYASFSTGNHSNKVPFHGSQQMVQNRTPSVQASSQRSQVSSPPAAGLSISSYEPADGDSDTGKAKAALVPKAKASIEGSGRGSFIYGTNVGGASSVIHGDQNFPAFLPVMQFGGQHPGGIGVPAVGMAFPGYVAQPQLGLGNSEMTWLPVLTGAAGALGATYCSPYLSVDGAYHSRPSAQNQSVASSSKEGSMNKINSDTKPASLRNEPGNDDLGQRQKPRRYSEMDFKQPSTST